MKFEGQAEPDVCSFLADWAKGPGDVIRLKGDASTRRYYRLDGFGVGRAVLMATGAPFGDKEAAFLGIRKFLREIGVPVPEILAAFPEKGMLLLEDLGDISLRAFLESHGADARRPVMEEAIDIILRMQKEGTARLTSDCPAYHVRFDPEIFYRELRFFHENFLIVVSRAIPSRLEEELDGFYSGLAGELAGYSSVFCHRDYHVDNLYFHKAKVYVIDFQDARIGPPAYDLASFLTDRDIRGLLGDELRDRLFESYMKGMGANRRDFDYPYALAAVQRCLKAVGTFGFQMFARGNQSYKRFIPPTISEFRREVRNLPPYAQMDEKIMELLPEEWREN
jgi:hypothetical protein